MRKFINHTVESLAPSGIRRFFNLANEIEGVISLGVGEPDFMTPWNVREEAIYSLQQGRTVYTANAGLIELRKELSNYLKRKYRLEYDPASQILVTVGGSEAIDVALRCILEPGDEVLVPEPSYVAYRPCTIMAGGIPVSVNLKGENAFKLTKADLKGVITEKTKVLIFPYPGNPTGAVMREEDMRELCAFICEKDLFVISDEIYAELTYEGRHVSIASMPGMAERTLVINGFSKAFSMTGWRLGYAAGPKELMTQMTKVHQFSIMCAPTTSQYAAIEALRNCDRAVEEMCAEYNRRRRLVVTTLNSMGLTCADPQGAFYAFPSIQKTGMTSEAFCHDLLNKKKIAVVPGDAFGASGEGYVRISYAYSVDKLKKALNGIRAYLEEEF